MPDFDATKVRIPVAGLAPTVVAMGLLHAATCCDALPRCVEMARWILDAPKVRNNNNNFVLAAFCFAAEVARSWHWAGASVAASGRVEVLGVGPSEEMY